MAALADAGEPEHDLLSESRDPHLGAGAGRRRRIACRVASGAAGGGVDAPGGIISNGALAWNDGGKPITTSNTNLAVSTRRCIRARTTGRSCRSTPRATPARRPQIFSFVWLWPGTTTPTVTDMVPGVEIYDPLFQWAPIPGAASYEMEINTTSGFATGSQAVLRRRPRRRRSPRPRRCRTTRTTGASAASTRRARPAPGTTARRSTRPTTRRSSPDRPT